MTWCIYKHTNKINGKVYIGQTCQKPERRWQNGKGYEGSPKFWPAIVEYGWDNFDHDIIVDNITSQQEANELEQKYIAQYNSYEDGYNATLGGAFEEVEVICIEDNKIFNSGAECAKAYNISTQNLFQNCCKNHRTLKNKHFAYLSEWLSGEWNPAEPYDTTRRKEASVQKKEVYCKQTNKFYSSATEVAELLELNPRSVCKVCSGELIQTGGYNFCWKTDWYEDWQPRKNIQGQRTQELTAQQRENIKNAARARNENIIICVETGVIYHSYAEAQEKTKIDGTCISRACRGKQKTAGGYHWQFYVEGGEE